MKKLLKLAGLLIIVIIVAVLAFVMTFDANRYKQDIISQVEAYSGRKLTIDGDIGLTIFPWVGFKIEKVSLGNANGFSEDAFAEIAKLEVKVELLPLLSQKIRVDKLKLEGAAVSLEIDESGNTNWSDLVKQAAPGADAGAETHEKNKPGSDSKNQILAGLSVSGVEIIKSSFSWTDRQSDLVARLSSVSLKTGAIALEEKIAIEFGADVVTSRPDITAKVTMSTNLTANAALDTFDIDSLQLSVVAILKEITSTPIALKVNTQAKVDLDKNIARFSLTQIATAGAAFNANFEVTDLTTLPVVKGAVASNAINGRVIAKKFNIALPKMADKNSLTNLSVRSNFKASATSLQLDDLIVGLDDSRLSGWLHILDLKQPNVRFDLKLDPVVADNYLPPADKTSASETKARPEDKEKQKIIADTPIVLPVELLRTLDMDGSLSIERIAVKEMYVHHINVPVKAAHGIIIASPVSMKIIDGTITSKIGLDVRGTPKYIVDMKGDKLVAGSIVDPMLESILGDDKVKMHGDTRFNVNIQTQGDSVLALIKSATGKLQIDIDKTEFKGVDFKYIVHQKAADYIDFEKIPFSDDFRNEYRPDHKSVFNRFHASFTPSNGRLVNKDLILESKELNITGSGFIDMVNETVDYRPVLDFNTIGTKRHVDTVKDIPMEFYIHGPLGAPQFEFNKKKYFGEVTNLLKKEARAKISKKVEAVKQEKKQELKESIKDKGKELLKGLIK